ATLQAELAHDSATGFITCDVTGQVLGISPALARWLERPPNPAPGLLAQDLFEPAFFSTLDRAIRTHRRGERIGPFETSATSAAGARLPVRLIGREMPGQRSRVLWFGIEDISARVRSERLRTDAQLTEKLGVLASGIAHEFNNLLGVIIGRIDMAIDLNKDEKVAPHLERASEAAVRAATISNGLRGSAEQQSLRAVGTFSLATLLEQYWPLLRNLVPSSIAFEREAFDANLSISVDPNDFLGILMRIVENAAEASSPGDRIVVRARSEGLSDASPNSHRVLLEIQDVGVGMSRDAVSRAFEAFFTTKAPAHVGLGLSEVASMAERNHASVSIQSNPGMGSTVQVEFAAA
ncbi:MAG: ATP-binding protein, partial [Quisquiliibacterium sp.]